MFLLDRPMNGAESLLAAGRVHDGGGGAVASETLLAAPRGKNTGAARQGIYVPLFYYYIKAASPAPSETGGIQMKKR